MADFIEAIAAIESIECEGAPRDLGLDLVLENEKPPVFHGDRGLSRKGTDPGNAVSAGTSLLPNEPSMKYFCRSGSSSLRPLLNKAMRSPRSSRISWSQLEPDRASWSWCLGTWTSLAALVLCHGSSVWGAL